MKRLLLIPLLALTLAAGGCEKFQKFGQLVGAATSEIANPVGDSGLHKVKAAYGVGVSVLDKYRVYCWSRPLADLPQAICGNRREVTRRAIDAGLKAKAAIATAEKFIRENPKISAMSLVTAAKNAVTDFEAATAAAKTQ